jgi:hypothetical protein
MGFNSAFKALIKANNNKWQAKQQTGNIRTGPKI